MTSVIKVSVIIPVYNTEAYLRPCLDSVINQGIDDMEIICVNDGSTDNASSILAEYKELDSRICVIEQENRGQACARNVGIQKAVGEYICFLDSDDMLVDNAIVEMYECAKKNELDILYFDAMCMYETDELRKKDHKDGYYRRKRNYGETSNGKKLFCELIENDDFCDSACLMFVNRHWLEGSGISFYAGIIHEDCLFAFQCFMMAERVKHIKKDYLKYRIRQGSTMTSKASYVSLKGRIICYTRIFEYLLNEELSEREKEAIAKFAKFIMYNIKWVDYKLDDEERSKAIGADVIEQLISASMDVGLERQYGISENIYLRGFDDMLASFSKIILYGAGKIGRKLHRYVNLKGYGNKVQYFTVSDKGAEEQYIDGTPVKRIDEVEVEDDILVLITARRDYQENMLLNARKCGFKNIEVIDLRLEQIIDKSLS